MSEKPCTCMVMDGRELMQRWRLRAQPTIKRLILRGHPISLARIAETVRLIGLIENGHLDTLSEANAFRSHHLPGCPQSIRNRRLNTVSMSL